MKLSLDALTTVAAIATEGSINRAADALHRAPSTVWYAVKKLERDLGLRVLKRQGRGVILTPEGRELLERGGLVLELVGDLERSLERIASGWEASLRIALGDVVPDEWFIELLAELDSVSPSTTVSITREVLAGTWDAILSRRADIVIGAPCAPPDARDIVGVALGEIEFVYVVAPGHPLADATESLTLNILGHHRVAVIPDTSRALPPMTTAGLFPNHPMLRVPDYRMKRMVQVRGLAAGFLPLHLAEPDINAGRLIRKSVNGEPFTEPVWMGWRADQSGKALEWLRNRLSNASANWVVEAPNLRG